MGVLLPVCRACKSRQKVGRQTFSATRSGGEGKTERGIPRPTKRHPGKCKVSTENGNKDSPRARKTQNWRQMDTKTEKGWSTGKFRAMARSTLLECGCRREASGRGRRVGGALPGSPCAHCRVQSPAARQGDWWLGLGLGGRSGEQSESLTSPRPEESSKFAPRDHSSASPLGRKPLRLRRALLPRCWSGRCLGERRRVGAVAPSLGSG